jgi:hypothetical protein
MEKGRATTASGNVEEVWGILCFFELIHAVGFFAVATYCRFGGRNSTSGVEAFARSGHGSSKPAHHEVICSPWRAGGPWLRLVVGRGLPSCRPLFLGGDASRTPARGGCGALGLDCLVSASFRVLYVKSSAFSLDRSLPRTRMLKGCSLSCTCLGF